MASSNSNIELLRNPLGYAKKAILVIESQLESAKSSNRKIKLNSRLSQWKKFVEMMESERNDKENNL